MMFVSRLKNVDLKMKSEQDKIKREFVTVLQSKEDELMMFSHKREE